MGILLSRAKYYDWLFRTLMPMLRRQDLLRRTVFLLGGKVGIWKQARELVVMSEPKSTGPLTLPADKFTQGDIPLGLMQTSVHFRLNCMPHGRHIKDERKEIIIWPETVEYPFSSTSGIFKPISGLCRSH